MRMKGGRNRGEETGIDDQGNGAGIPVRSHRRAGGGPNGIRRRSPSGVPGGFCRAAEPRGNAPKPVPKHHDRQ